MKWGKPDGGKGKRMLGNKANALLRQINKSSNPLVTMQKLHLLVFSLTLSLCSAARVKTGIEVLAERSFDLLQDRKFGTSAELCVISRSLFVFLNTFRTIRRILSVCRFWYVAGILTNPTGIFPNLSHIVDVLHEVPAVRDNFIAVFGPEHGFRGDQQAGNGV